MRILYLDCGMGAAGDMLSAALYELLEDAEKTAFLAKMNSLGLPEVSVSAEATQKCGIRGTRMRVVIAGGEEESDDAQGHEHCHDMQEHRHGHEHCHDRQEQEPAYVHTHDHTHEHGHEHHHRGMRDIEGLVSSFPLDAALREQILAVYQRIAEAESSVHGVPVTEIHFHEVGALDAVADVAAVCVLMEMLAVDQVAVSPVHVGSGQVHCAHGMLPVPAPATAELLKGIPIYGGSIAGELCTPTGAALLAHFGSKFGEMPPMCVDQIGYGCGKKDFPVANCVRALLGETAGNTNQVMELRCNVDDMTPERIGFAMERLFEAGALEVYTVPVGMKKSRPGILLSVMCREADRDQMIGMIFKYTTTIGIRENVSRRYTLERSMSELNTVYGKVRVKRTEGYGVMREKYEYEDLARIAREQGMSLDEAAKRIAREFRSGDRC